MSRFRLAVPLLALALLVPAAPLQAQEPSPVAEYRAALMQGLRHHNGALRQLLSGDVALGAHASMHARAVRDLAIMAGDAFPEGSGEGSRALPEVWSDAEGFAERLTVLRTASAELAAAAEEGNVVAMREAAGAVGQSCRGCHTTYRADNQ